MVAIEGSFTWHVNPSTRPVTAGRFGRDPVGPPQGTIPMVNDPAVVPNENVYYPSPAPPRVEVPFEAFQFSVQGPPAVDNGHMLLHIQWANPANDWDVYVLDLPSWRSARSSCDHRSSVPGVVSDKKGSLTVGMGWTGPAGRSTSP